MAAKAAKNGPQDLAAVLAGIEKDFGAGTLIRLGEAPLEVPEVFSSGSIALDEALGVGGLAYGRIMEFYGPESSGKTSLALHATGNAQRQCAKCRAPEDGHAADHEFAATRAAFIDAEHALDPEWAATLGVDTDALYVSQPGSGEQALQVADRLVRSGQFGVITIDSVAALVPEAELNGQVGDTHVGLMARMMSQGLRMLAGPCAETGTTIIFINQLREKVGVFFGNSETQPGGKALKFYSSVRLDVRRIQTLKSGNTAIGSRVRVKVVKNKLGPPFRQAEFDFIFGTGISRERELLDLAVERKVVRKSGAHYTRAGLNEQGVPFTVMLGNGKEAAQQYLCAHPETADEIEAAVRAEGYQAPPPRAAQDKAPLVMDGPAPWDEPEEDQA